MSATVLSLTNFGGAGYGDEEGVTIMSFESAGIDNPGVLSAHRQREVKEGLSSVPAISLQAPVPP